MFFHILFIAKRNPATSLGVRKANSEPAEIVAGKSLFHLLYKRLLTAELNLV